MSAQARQFELAVRSFSRDLYCFAFWLAKDRQTAEDLVQECFQRAWRNWESLEDEVALKKWLFTILRREFLRRFERRRLDSVEIDALEFLASGGLGLDEACAVRQALASAPASLREPLLMQVLGGFSAEEIATLHQTTVGAIGTRLSRARQWLRARLNGEETEVRREPEKGNGVR